MSGTEKIVTSAANPAIKRLQSLAQKKYRDEEGVFIVEGGRHIADALEAGWTLDTLAFTSAARHDHLLEKSLQAAKTARADCMEVTPDLMTRITKRDNAQDILAAFRIRYHDIAEIAVAQPGLWLALEDIRDPGNLGTIMRTADAVGVAGIVLIGQTCDPFSPEAVRATMGSFARMKVFKSGRDEFLHWRPQFNGRLVGTHLKATHDYRGADYALPLLLAMGSEQAGLSHALSNACDLLVRIPMTLQVESLNLAVSTGITLYEICREKI